MPKLIIFDLDGTLIDSLEDLADAMNAVLARAGLPTHPVDAYRHFVGDGIANLARRALPTEHRVEEEVSRFRDLLREEYDRRWLDKTRPYPGIPEMLESLRARGTPVAVLSNKLHHATEHVVRVLFPDYPFAVVRGSFPDIPLKPDPAGARWISQHLGIAPGQTLYVGDTDTDMKTGLAAGFTAVGVAWGFRPVRELEENGAQRILHHPSDLLTLL